MSYILDALKRADAERERGTVPGLHAQPIAGVSPGRPGAGTRAREWPLLAIVLALGGIAAGIWVWRILAGGERTPVVVAAVAVAPAAAPQPTLASTPAVQPAASQPPTLSPTTPTTPVAPPALPADPGLTPIPQTIPSGTGLLVPGPAVNLPPMTPPPAVQPAPPAPPPARAPAPVPQAQAKPTNGAPAASPARGANPAQAVPKPAAAASAAQTVPGIVPLLSELPEEIRRPIPPLTITGAVYSENPAQRLLLVNGQVLPQGAAAAPEVMIEEIRARSSIFTFRGSRFRVTY